MVAAAAGTARRRCLATRRRRRLCWLGWLARRGAAIVRWGGWQRARNGLFSRILPHNAIVELPPPPAPSWWRLPAAARRSWRRRRLTTLQRWVPQPCRRRSTGSDGGAGASAPRRCNGVEAAAAGLGVAATAERTTESARPGLAGGQGGRGGCGARRECGRARGEAGPSLPASLPPPTAELPPPLQRRRGGVLPVGARGRRPSARQQLGCLLDAKRDQTARGSAPITSDVVRAGGDRVGHAIHHGA